MSRAKLETSGFTKSVNEVGKIVRLPFVMHVMSLRDARLRSARSARVVRSAALSMSSHCFSEGAIQRLPSRNAFHCCTNQS